MSVNNSYTIEEIRKHFKTKHSISDKTTFITNILTQCRLSTDPNSKKILKHILNVILEHIDEISYKDAKEFLLSIQPSLYELCVMFPDILNEFTISKVVSFCKDMSKQENLTQIKEYNVYKFSLFVIVLTPNLGQTNQIISNFISFLNTFIENIIINIEDLSSLYTNVVKKALFLSLSQIICENVNSYNPTLLNQTETILYILNTQSLLVSSESISNLDEFSSHIINSSSPCSNVELMKSIFKHIIPRILNLFKQKHQDINADFLLGNIFTLLMELSTKFGFGEDRRIKEIISLHNEAKISCGEKKSIPINFLVIKKKPLPSLEPDYDLSFLGPGHESLNERKQRTAHAIQKKIKSTKKQTIRKFKKEARILDKQRQANVDLIRKRRMEDLKESNKFVEQQNIEYKKLMTSQNKKRYKFKNRLSMNKK